jgi:hypothetical protein
VIGSGRPATTSPGTAGEVADVPVKFDGASERLDVNSGQVITTRPQMLMRVSAASAMVGGQNGTEILDNLSGETFQAYDILRDELYARVLLTEA